MKQNILLLINGFGIAQPGSYDIYNAELMPNLDRLTKERLFQSIPNTYLDYKSAYRNFSIGINDALTYNIIDNNVFNAEYANNQLLKYIENQANVAGKRNIHILCYWDCEKTIEQLVAYVYELHSNIEGNVYVHFILCQKSLNDYKYMEKGFTKIGYEIGNNVKLGIVIGEKNIDDNIELKNFVKLLITEYGEKWKDVGKKIEVLNTSKTTPDRTRAFGASYGFKLEEGDQFLVFNYSSVDITKIRSELLAQKYKQLDFSKVKTYSLFPLKSDETVPFMYNFAVSSTYLLNSLKNINARCLVYDTKVNCSFINYYLTGLRNEIDEHIRYIPTDDGFIYDKDKLMANIKLQDKELIIINYEIDSAKNMDEMASKLKQIDDIIGVLDSYVREKGAAMFITSFYGIQKELYNQKQELCNINFSNRVPLVIDDASITASSYSVTEGSLFDLSNAILSNISKDYRQQGLLRKKSSLLSIFYKKPKGDK